ncbi:MAG: hypothetical protein ACO2ZM_09735 [Francisellaceae bacterium]
MGAADENTSVYKLISTKKNKVGEHIAVIQIKNTRNTFQMTPEDILTDDGLLHLFSKRDIRTLTQLGHQNLHQPKYKIVDIRIADGVEDSYAFIFKKKGGLKTHSRLARTLLQNKSMLYQFPPEDIYRISFAAGNEVGKRDRQMAMLNADHAL